jgi:hypothetical protein
MWEVPGGDERRSGCDGEDANSPPGMILAALGSFRPNSAVNQTITCEPSPQRSVSAPGNDYHPPRGGGPRRIRPDTN